MKLLLDENLSRRLVPFLQESYPGSSQVILEGLEGADDKAVWDYAKKNDFVLVTKDADFRDYATVLGCPPAVIWLRTGNSRKELTLKALVDNHDKIETALTASIGIIELM